MRKLQERLEYIAAVAIAIVLAWLLYAYIFSWHNLPNLAKLLGLNV